MNMPPERSLVIPAFNESARLANGFARLAPVLEAWGPETTEVVLVDDGSRDDTLRVIAQVYGHLPHLKVIQHETNRGKGAAVRTGWASAAAPHVITADADMAIVPAHFPAFDTALRAAQFTPGSRTDGSVIRYDSWRRTIAGFAFHQVVAHYTGTGIRDTQCGCKGMRLEVARLFGLLGMIEGFAFDAELFYFATALGLSTQTVLVTWDDVAGSTVRSPSVRKIFSDIRGIPRTRYENPVIVLDRNVDVTTVRQACIHVRQRGLVIARREQDALVIMPRDGGLNAITMANELGGTLRVGSLNEYRGATFEAV